MSDRVAFEDIASATILKPGDSVLLVLDGDPTQDQLFSFQKVLTERFPGTTFTLASGVDAVIVKPADD